LLCRFSVRAYNPVEAVVQLDYFVPGMKLVVDYFWLGWGEKDPHALRVEIDPETKQRSVGFNDNLKKETSLADPSRVRFSFGPKGSPRVIWINCDNAYRSDNKPKATWVVVSLKFDGHDASAPIVIPPKLTEQTGDEKYRHGEFPRFEQLSGLFYPLWGGTKGLNAETKPFPDD
jgi:hypothetical protein